ncbi:MAG: hypothetical protein RLZZ135_846 [Cyanobacteriota bacterium]|jgi:hypothetical protein
MKSNYPQSSKMVEVSQSSSRIKNTPAAIDPRLPTL